MHSKRENRIKQGNDRESKGENLWKLGSRKYSSLSSHSALWLPQPWALLKLRLGSLFSYLTLYKIMLILSSLLLFCHKINTLPLGNFIKASILGKSRQQLLKKISLGAPGWCSWLGVWLGFDLVMAGVVRATPSSAQSLLEFLSPSSSAPPSRMLSRSLTEINKP